MLRRRKVQAAIVAAVALGIGGGVAVTDSCGCVTPVFPDITPPVVTITSPSNGATLVGSSVTFAATASDDKALAGVTFKVDGTAIGVEDTFPPFATTIDSTTLTNGAHVLTAVARDASSNTATATANVTVTNVVAPSGTANIWVDGNGGTCQWHPTPLIYTGTGDTTSCSTMNAANLVSAAGGLVRLKCGSYAAQTINNLAAQDTFSQNVTFTSENDQNGCALTGDLNINSSHLTISHLSRNDAATCVSTGYSYTVGNPGIPYVFPACDSVSVGAGGCPPGSAADVTNDVIDNLDYAYFTSTSSLFTVQNSNWGPSWDNHGIIHSKSVSCGTRPSITWVNNVIHNQLNTPEYLGGCPNRPDATPGVGDGCGTNNGVAVSLHEGGITFNDTNGSTYDRSRCYNVQDICLLLKPGVLSKNDNLTVTNSYFGVAPDGTTCPASCKIDMTNINLDQTNMVFINNTLNGSNLVFGNSTGTLCTGCKWLYNIGNPNAGFSQFGAPWTVDHNWTSASSVTCGGATCTSNTGNLAFGPTFQSDGYHLTPAATILRVLPAGLPSAQTHDIDNDIRSSTPSPGADDGPSPSDTTSPSVSVTAPAAGATVSGTSAPVTASASDNVGVVGVQFKLDGNPLGAEDTSAPYAITWDTTTTSSAAHVLTAFARDAAGNTTTSSSVSVTVNNTPPDTTAPTVSVTAPTGGATITGSTTITASASDNVGVLGVQFKLDGNILGAEDTAAPYSLVWDSATSTDGAHVITAVARDAATNTTTSGGVSITTNNSTSVIGASQATCSPACGDPTSTPCGPSPTCNVNQISVGNISNGTTTTARVYYFSQPTNLVGHPPAVVIMSGSGVCGTSETGATGTFQQSQIGPLEKTYKFITIMLAKATSTCTTNSSWQNNNQDCGGVDTTLSGNTVAGASTVTLTIASPAKLFPGDVEIIGSGGTQETRTVLSSNTTGSQVTFTTPLSFAHNSAESIHSTRSAFGTPFAGICGTTNGESDTPYITAVYNDLCGATPRSFNGITVDCARLYLMGVSAGSSMARAVACDASAFQMFRGYSAISSTPQSVYQGYNQTITPSSSPCPGGPRPVFMQFIDGSADSVYGTGDAPGSCNQAGQLPCDHSSLGFLKGRDWYATFAGCGSVTATGTTVLKYDYDCGIGTSAPDFEAIGVVNGGHTWCGLDIPHYSGCTGAFGTNSYASTQSALDFWWQTAS